MSNNASNAKNDCYGCWFSGKDCGSHTCDVCGAEDTALDADYSYEGDRWVGGQRCSEGCDHG